MILLLYRTDQLQSPKDTVDGFEQVVPGFCDYLTACKEGRMLFIPREEASIREISKIVDDKLTMISRGADKQGGSHKTVMKSGGGLHDISNILILLIL